VYSKPEGADLGGSMPNSFSNVVIIVELRDRVIAVASTILCDVWEGSGEKVIGNCSGMVLFGSNKRRVTAQRARRRGGFSYMYISVGCLGPVALADLGAMTATKE